MIHLILQLIQKKIPARSRHQTGKVPCLEDHGEIYFFSQVSARRHTVGLGFVFSVNYWNKDFVYRSEDT